MIVRPHYMKILKTYRDIPLVKILAGIRRCGKSTILEMLREDLLQSGSAPHQCAGEGRVPLPLRNSACRKRGDSRV